LKNTSFFHKRLLNSKNITKMPEYFKKNSPHVTHTHPQDGVRQGKRWFSLVIPVVIIPPTAAKIADC
jgi:hypothetical protein